jgi:hypothetical protein
MNWTLIFFFTTLLCICMITYLATKLCRVREQLSIIKDALEDKKRKPQSTYPYEKKRYDKDDMLQY